jgi:hypothetical protein
MTSAQMPSFDLAEEMIDTLRQELGPDQLRAGLEDALGKGQAPQAFFAEFGRKWMGRTVELGEKHTDQTYETLKSAVEKIGTLAFPYIAQRFIEIAYLGTQPIYTLPIAENWSEALSFKTPFCEYYKAIEASQGEEFAKDLHCRAACEEACRVAFAHSGFPVSISFKAEMPSDGFCHIEARKA